MNSETEGREKLPKIIRYGLKFLQVQAEDCGSLALGQKTEQNRRDAALDLSFFLLHLEVLSDVVVRGFTQRLPQSDLQGHESPHGHVEEDLPHVPQFIQIHVGQADECKGQEGFTVPPHGEVGKQVALQ